MQIHALPVLLKIKLKLAFKGRRPFPHPRLDKKQRRIPLLLRLCLALLLGPPQSFSPSAGSQHVLLKAALAIARWPVVCDQKTAVGAGRHANFSGAPPNNLRATREGAASKAHDLVTCIKLTFDRDRMHSADCAVLVNKPTCPCDQKQRPDSPQDQRN